MTEQFWYAGALILLALCCLLTLIRVRQLEKDVKELRGKCTPVPRGKGNYIV